MPVISSGVSVVNGHFDKVYGMFSNVLAANEALQTIGRVRTAKEIFLSYKSNYAKDTFKGSRCLHEAKLNENLCNTHLAELKIKSL